MCQLPCHSPLCCWNFIVSGHQSEFYEEHMWYSILAGLNLVGAEELGKQDIMEGSQA